LTEANPSVKAIGAEPERAKARLDQWLWFARFVKSRSLAARLCAAGAVAVNGSPARKANQSVRVGDVVVLPQGGRQLIVRVLALGSRRGPAAEARRLYEEAAAAARLRDIMPDWVPLLDADEAQPLHAAAATGDR
jgi:ribosome-associated heat shock protein Hsp15